MFWVHLAHEVHNFTFSFNMMILSSIISVLKYYPGTSKVATSIPSCVSMIRLVNSDSKYMVSEDASSIYM